MEKNRWHQRSHLSLLSIVAIAGLIYFFSNPRPQNYYDYTFRIAESFLHGRIGIREPPPHWLNEFIPAGDEFYSAFPLGAALTMLPFALLRAAGVIAEIPGGAVAAVLASGICLFLMLISDRYQISLERKVLLTAAILFGTWMWVDLTFAGAWQLALGLAVVGELGAIHFTAFDRRPLIAGLFFAIAFGNRTEVLLMAPIFYLLLARESQTDPALDLNRRAALRWLLFSIVPLVLGASTLYYNYIRFGSVADFGYERIPGVLAEPWYQHGIFSFYYMPRQAFEMLLKPWVFRDSFPYLVPNGFSSSIIWSSPFLLFIFRPSTQDHVLKICAYAAIVVLTLVYLLHGNSGGWQFGYRYAMVLLPWVFILLLESSPKRTSVLEWTAFGSSFLINAYAVWLFHWSPYMKP